MTYEAAIEVAIDAMLARIYQLRNSDEIVDENILKCYIEAFDIIENVRKDPREWRRVTQPLVSDVEIY